MYAILHTVFVVLAALGLWFVLSMAVAVLWIIWRGHLAPGRW